MHDMELFTAWVGLSIISLHPIDNVEESISWPAELVILFCDHLEQRALTYPLTIEQIHYLHCSKVNQIFYNHQPIKTLTCGTINTG